MIYSKKTTVIIIVSYLVAIIMITLIGKTINSFMIACIIMSFLLLISNVRIRFFKKKERNIQAYLAEISLLFLILVCIYFYIVRNFF
jgi:phosphatidylserine synthase